MASNWISSLILILAEGAQISGGFVIGLAIIQAFWRACLDFFLLVKWSISL